MRNLKRSLKSGIVLVSAPTFSYKVSYNRIFYTLITFFLIHSHVLRKTFYLKVLNVYSSLIRKTKFQTYEKISFYHLCSFLSLLFYERMNYKSITEIYERLFRIRITILLVLTRYIFLMLYRYEYFQCLLHTSPRIKLQSAMLDYVTACRSLVYHGLSYKVSTHISSNLSLD